MDTLTPEQRARLEELKESIKEKEADLEAAVDHFNSEMEELWSKIVEDAADNLATAQEEAGAFIEEVHSDMVDHYESQDEDWQEENSEYEDWVEEWQSVGYDIDSEIEVACPDQIYFSGSNEGLPSKELDKLREAP